MNHMHHHNQPDQKFLNKIAFLDSKQREQLIPPEILISQMPIQKNHTLLDVGAGSGFFQFLWQKAHPAKCTLWIPTDECFVS
jgi:ubiquinone/menaquinone biosynthesis C-methylase UbiE